MHQKTCHIVSKGRPFFVVQALVTCAIPNFPRPTSFVATVGSDTQLLPLNVECGQDMVEYPFHLDHDHVSFKVRLHCSLSDSYVRWSKFQITSVTPKSSQFFRPPFHVSGSSFLTTACPDTSNHKDAAPTPVTMVFSIKFRYIIVSLGAGSPL